MNEREQFKSIKEYNPMTQAVEKIRIDKAWIRALSYFMVVSFIAIFVLSQVLIETWSDGMAER